MKKVFSLLTAIAVAVPLIVSAAGLDHDILYGALHNPDVTILQKFLTGRGLYSGPITGNFLSLTKKALVAFQMEEGIMPAQGYFGSQTRAKINVLIGAMPSSREELIASLQAQIQALQAKLSDLLKAAVEKQAAIATSTSTVSPSPSPAPSSSPMPTPTPTPSPSPAPIAELRISGTSTQPFPQTAVSPLKLGDIVIKNTKDHPILFNQFQLDIYDAMNSSLNRSKTVLFKLRSGTTTFDSLISETKFDINREPPPLGQENRRQVNVSFPITVKAGETNISSLWIENLDYVVSGYLRIEMLTAYINDNMAPQGGFTFLLTNH